MRKNIWYVVMSIGLIMLLSSCEIATSEAIPYLDAIDELCSRDIDAMSLMVDNVSDLDYSDHRVHVVETGGKDDNFRASTYDGVKLWSAVELFQHIDHLEVVRTDPFNFYLGEESNYWHVRINTDFEENNVSTISVLHMFIRKSNYNIILPESYLFPEVIDESMNYVEYKSDAIVEELVDNLLFISEQE